jgi:ankyrin repeat protein
MARQKTKQKQVTTLVPHRTPNLSVLLERAKDGASAQAVKDYLDAGGSAMAILQADGVEDALRLPLLHYMALRNPHPHTELAECINLLVEAGADINATASPDDDERTALMCASALVNICCTTALQILVSYLPYLRVVNETLKLQILVERGADVLVTTADGLTALHFAATAGQTDCCEALLARESNLIHMKSADGHTALLCATQYGSMETVKLLHRHGADPSTANDDGVAPLMAATLRKRVDMVVYLLTAGVDVNTVDSRGHTALFGAVYENSVPIVQLLLEHGADISVTDCQGQNALSKAAHKGHVFMMELLVNRSLSVTAVDNTADTVLLIAVHSKQNAAAEWLVTC